MACFTIFLSPGGMKLLIPLACYFTYESIYRNCKIMFCWAIRLGMYYKEKDRDKRALNKCEHLLDHAHIKVYMYFFVCIIIYSGLYFELLTII